MRSTRVLSVGVAAGLVLVLVSAAVPPPAHAVWNVGGQFKVGGQLRAITPTATTFPDGTVNPTCDTQGGTSLAIVQSSKLAGVDPTLGIVLVVTCLDNGGTATAVARRARLNFLNPADGTVVKSISTTTTPSNGWAHLVHRPDKGDLLGCGNDGTIYSIDFSQFTSTADGTATLLPRPSGLTNCAGLAWDPEEDMIYQGVTGGTSTVGVHRFKDGTTTDLGTFNTPCPPIGVAVTGGALVVACNGASTVLRLDKGSGTILGVNGTLGVLGLAAGTNLNPGLGDLACDPVTFRKDSTGKDQFTDALWSRRGANGNGAVALEFPAFTCGLPSNATLLAAGLSAPAVGQSGAVPLAACFDANGKVKDSDGDGLPDCWETSGIDFDGDGTVDLTLCVQGDTNGDGVPDATECADPNHKDLFVEIDYMQNHKPDPLALSQTQSVASVGVKSVREAFGAAPVTNNNPPDATTGIRTHFQVDEQVTFTTLAGTPPATSGHVAELVFTPCTPPATNPNGTLNVKSLSDAADFDAIKNLNFGTASERASANKVKILNAKRLAFRYVLFAHNQTGSNQTGSTASGCSEVGGDDAATTLGSFTATTVGGVTHNRGTTDQQAGTFMHEFGHLLGLRHGGDDNDNCKPNYLSVMSYTRQIAGSPIPSRRLDYSRAKLPALGLNETSLLEPAGLCPGCDAATLATLGPLSPFFPSADQTAFGPSVWSVATANTPAINWSKDKTKQGAPIIETTPVSGNINQGSGGCDGSDTLLNGHDDWHNLLYRASAALEFAGGARTTTKDEHTSLTKEQEEQLFAAADLDGNGVADAQDCGFTATGVTTSPVDATATTVPIGTNPITRGFAAAGIAFLGTGSSSDDFSYTGTDNTGFTGVTGVSTVWPSGTTVTGALAPTGVTSSPVDPTATSVPIGANPATRGFAAAGTAFLGTSSNSDAFSYTGADNNGFTGVTGVSAAWPSATTVTGPACTHRIDIKPSAPADSTGAKTVNLGTESTVTIAIFAEVNPSTPFPAVGNGLWDPSVEVVTLCLQPATSDCLTFSVESLNLPVKTNKNGQGTCSPRDVADPTTNVKDGFKDFLCQFPTSGLPLGKHQGVVSGFFVDPASGETRAFRARQDFIIAK